MNQHPLAVGAYAVHRRGSNPLRVIQLDGDLAVVQNLRFGYQTEVPVADLVVLTWEEANVALRLSGAPERKKKPGRR